MKKGERMSETKKWKTVKILSTYEDASGLKNKLLAEDKTSTLQIKIKRCGDGGSNFKVKSWQLREKLKEKQPKGKTKKKAKSKGNKK